jgi:hypothetical protein
MGRVVASFASAFCGALLLAGCGGVHFYNADKDKLGQTAKKNFVDSRFTEVIPVHEANLDKMLAQELTMVSRYQRWQAQADVSFAIESSQPVETVWLDETVIQRLKNIGFGGSDPEAAATTYLQAVVTLPETKRTLAINVNDYEQKFEISPKCVSKPSPDKLDPTVKARFVKRTIAGSKNRAADSAQAAKFADKAHTKFIKNCNKFLKVEELRRSSQTGSQLAESRAEVKRLTSLIKANENNAKKLAPKLQAVICEIKTGSPVLKDAPKKGGAGKAKGSGKKVCAAKAISETTEDLPSKVFKDQIEKAQKVIAQLKMGAGLFGELEALDQRIKEVDNVLTAISGGEVDEKDFAPGGKQLAAMAAGLLEFADEAQKQAKQNALAPATALIIAKKQLEARRAEVVAQIARAQTRVAMHRRKLAALEEELDLLLDAIKFWNWAKEERQKFEGEPADVKKAYFKAAKVTARDLGDGTAAAFLAGKYGKFAKERLQTAFVRYAASVVRARAVQEETDWRLIDVQYREGVDANKASIDQWNAIIAPSIDQISAFLASGLKAEEVAALIVQLTTLSAIAAGVNK